MVDGLVKIIQGIFKLRGATDQTLIGNVGDRLKVDATISTPNDVAIQFIKDGITVNVEEDTSVPANNVPLPVKLTGITGDITITANDLNVSLSHLNDSVKLGDGTTLAGVTLSNELKTNDATAIASLQIIDDIAHSQNTSLNKGVPIMGQYDDVTTTLATENNVAVARITEQRALHSNLRDDNGDETGISTNPLYITPVGGNTANINATISVGIVSTLLLASNSNRKIAYIVNNSSAKIFLKLGSAAIAGEGLTLSPSDTFYIGNNFLWMGEVYGIKAAGVAVNIEVFEGVA